MWLGQQAALPVIEYGVYFSPAANISLKELCKASPCITPRVRESNVDAIIHSA